MLSPVQSIIAGQNITLIRAAVEGDGLYRFAGRVEMISHGDRLTVERDQQVVVSGFEHVEPGERQRQVRGNGAGDRDPVDASRIVDDVVSISEVEHVGVVA